MKIFGTEIFLCEHQISTFSPVRSQSRSQIAADSSTTSEPEKDIRNAQGWDPHTEGLRKMRGRWSSEVKPHNQGELRVIPGPWKKQKPEDAETCRVNANIAERNVKKPEMIIPCPRCNSTDTKFCYFNNYNVNQPRHFCKKCQRYWTAGGTMRNVPIGAGRRKNKHHHFPHYVSHHLHPATPTLVGVQPSTAENGFLQLLPPPPPQGHPPPLWLYPVWAETAMDSIQSKNSTSNSSPG